jgi:hypothetical protein
MNAPPDNIRNHLSYEPGTGVFRWIKSKSPQDRMAVDAVAGHLHHTGYRVIRFMDRPYLAHRLAWWFIHGVMPLGDIDHEDMDKDNNRIGNLRPATRSQNQANRGPPPKNTSGFKGVNLCKQTGRWLARIQVDDRRKHLGRFDSAEAAAQAYDIAARQLHGKYARLNFPTPSHSDWFGGIALAVAVLAGLVLA